MHSIGDYVGYGFLGTPSSWSLLGARRKAFLCCNSVCSRSILVLPFMMLSDLLASDFQHTLSIPRQRDGARETADTSSSMTLGLECIADQNF
jgi:hypothetical protein